MDSVVALSWPENAKVVECTREDECGTVPFEVIVDDSRRPILILGHNLPCVHKIDRDKYLPNSRRRMSGLEAIAMMALKELQGKEHPQEKRDEAVPSPAVVSNSSQEDDVSIHRQHDADRATRALPFERTEGEPQSAPDNVGEQANYSAIIADPNAWLKETEPFFTDTFASKIDPKFGVIDSVQANDVLCGRGGETNHHRYVPTERKEMR